MVAWLRASVVIGLTLALFGCGAETPGTQTPGEVPLGRWGGDAIEVTVMANGGTVRFCCATGTIDQPLVADASGHFEANGTYTFEGGPVPVEGFRAIPAQYSGTVDGSSMILRVSTASEILGPFTLTLGRPAILQNCVCPL